MWGLTEHLRFSRFFESALVSRVKQRISTRIVRLWRSLWLVLTWSELGDLGAREPTPARTHSPRPLVFEVFRAR